MMVSGETMPSTQTSEPTLDELVALLERTPAALRALLSGLPAAWLMHREREGTWNATEIVGHLVHGERTDWLPRVRMILATGDSVPFPPFQREAHREAAQPTLEAQLATIAALRAESLWAVRALALTPADLDRRGLHPVFGAVTLGQLLSAWAAHDLTHLHQLSRLLADRTRRAVGPWQRFLGVLHCDGHSEKA
jgi:hypothetical protein